jgi:hypothetical protein
MTTSKLAERILELQKKQINKIPQSNNHAPKQKEPYWTETRKSIPNVFLRSALFSASKLPKELREQLEDKSIPSQKGYSITYSGEQLDQGDLDVWALTVGMAKDEPDNTTSTHSTYKLLKLLGAADTGINRRCLKRRLCRLNSGEVTILKDGDLLFNGPLLQNFCQHEKSGYIVTCIDHQTRNMLATSDFTNLDWEIRQSLNGKLLAQWLHGYYSSHAAPIPIGTQTLKLFCGSKTVESYKFNQLLRCSLNDLREAHNRHGKAFEYKVIEGNVHVTKAPSVAQARHIEGKKKEKHRKRCLKRNYRSS